MKYRVHPLFRLAQAVEHGADGVGNASQKQQHKAGNREHLYGLLCKGNNGPAHADIADHGEDTVLFQVDGRQYRGQHRQRPLKAEEAPAQGRVQRTEGGQQHRGVGAADEEVNGAVVDDLHDLLAHAGLQSVVHAGNGEHGNEGGAVDGAADDAPVVLVQCRPHHAGQQYHNPQSSAHNVGNHVHELFSPGVVGKMPVT